MMRLQLEARVGYPPEVVCPFFADVRNELLWHPDVVSVEKMTLGPVGAGTHFRAKYRGLGLLEIELAKCHGPVSATFHCTGKKVRMVVEATFRPIEEGQATLLDVALVIHFRGLLRLLSPILAAKIRQDSKLKGEQLERGLALAAENAAKAVTSTESTSSEPTSTEPTASEPIGSEG